MKLLEYYARLRKDLVSIVAGVRNSNSDDVVWRWDNTTPNSETRKKLKKLFTGYLNLAEPFGLRVVTRHHGCQNPIHYESESGIFIHGMTWRDPDYIWDGNFIYQGERVCKCPCSAENEPTSHDVVDEIIYRKSADLPACETITTILLWVSSAIDNAEDRKPRSGIREYLLCAIIRLNEAILPITVDEYLEQQLGKNSGE